MPRHPEPLPPLLGDVFTTRAAREVGVGRQRLRRRSLDADIHGVRIPAGAGGDLVTRCRAFAARLGDDVFFSHSTAARLHGMPLPRHLERLPRAHVTVEAPTRAPHAAGLLGHSRRVAPGDVVLVDGLRVGSPERTWCELASALSLADLVAATDHVIHRRRRLSTPARLAERLGFGDRITRSRLLPAALELASDRAESPQESRLRVVCRQAGLPEPRVNHELVETESGRSRRLDLAWPDRRFAVEYQGDYHRSSSQWRRDMTRREGLRLVGWTVLEANADDLRDPDALVGRMRAALRMVG